MEIDPNLAEEDDKGKVDDDASLVEEPPLANQSSLGEKATDNPE